MGMQYPMGVVLITGATDGLGRALAERLARDGNELLVHGRDAERLARVADDLAAASEGPTPRTFLADLADLAEVRRLAAEVRDATDRLDVLVSNAGIGSGEPDGRDRRTSADGYELRFAVNFLAGFLLTLDLLPLLRA
jgi:NAD(P)-dependent dehydrogenase (short-subunit alcohol dehydrogenase family)